MALVKIKNFPDRMFAERAKQTLEHEKIGSIIQSPDAGFTGAGGIWSGPQGADLYVDEEHVDDARLILESLFNGI